MVKSSPSAPEEFTTVPIPVFSDTQRRCVVFYKKGRGDFIVKHINKGWDCFAMFHSKKYHR